MDQEIMKPEFQTNAQETDLSKVKIRNILSQRFKKHGFKKIISLILLAAICFCGGFLTDRFIIRHEMKNRFYGMHNIQHNISGNFYGNRSTKSLGRNRKQLSPANKVPSQNQQNGSTQTP